MVSRVVVCLVCLIVLSFSSVTSEAQYYGGSYGGPAVNQCAPPPCGPAPQCGPRSPFPCAGIFSACANICGACIGLPAACMASLLAPPRPPARNCQPTYCPPPCPPPVCAPPPCAPTPITKCKPAACMPSYPPVSYCAGPSCPGCPQCLRRGPGRGPRGLPYHYNSDASMSPGYTGLGQQAFEFPFNLFSAISNGGGGSW
jgi:hypothetical protein